MRLSIMIIFIMLSLCSLMAQPGPVNVEKLEQKLQELYAQIYDIKEQMQQTPNPELQAQLDQLIQQAKKLEEELQKMQPEAEPPEEPEPPDIPGFEPKRMPPGERPPMHGPEMQPPPPGPNMDELEKQLQEFRKAIKEIEKQIKSAAKEEKGKLESKRKKIQESIHQLEQKMQQQRRFPWQGRRPHERREEFRGQQPPREFGERLEGPIQEFMQELQEKSPKEYRKWIEQARRNPEEFRKQIGRMIQERREKHEMERIKRMDPELYKLMEQQRPLQQKLEKLVIELRKTPPEARDAAKVAEVQQILVALFDLRTSMKQHEIGRIQKDLEVKKQQLEKRQTNKSMIVDQKFKELMGEEGEWDW